MRDETPRRIWDQHAEILDAVILGDGPRAEQLARVHVTKTASVNFARLAKTREVADRNGDSHRLRRAQLV
jgi:DNA-binding GntR family transcriptional regulator